MNTAISDIVGRAIAELRPTQATIWVCENGDDWSMTMRCFLSRWTDQRVPVQVVAMTDPAAAADQAIRSAPDRTCVLWGLQQDNAAEVFAGVEAVHASRRPILQLVAQRNVTRTDQWRWTNFGVTAVVQNPDDLYRLMPLLQRYLDKP